jgi:hypothetical protein
MRTASRSTRPRWSQAVALLPAAQAPVGGSVTGPRAAGSAR